MPKLSLLLTWLLAPASFAAEPPDFASQTVAGRPLAMVKSTALERACTPDEQCSLEAGKLIIRTDKGELLHKPARRLRLVNHSCADAPMPAWDSARVYEVSAKGRAWGYCLEVPHDGMGLSGRSQRWSSVILVPHEGRRAHRFVGYWPGCDFLVERNRQQVSLPVIAPDMEHKEQLRLVWHTCSRKGCVREVDDRKVVGDPWGENGELRFEP